MTCRKCNRETPPDALHCPYCGSSLRPCKNTRKPRTRPNGTGSAYKRGKTWTARVVVGWKLIDGAKSTPIYRTKGGFQTKRDALAHCETLRKAPKTVSKPTMQEIYAAWLPTHEGRVSASTMNCYRAAWKYFAGIYYLTIPDITIDDLQECLDDCPKGKRTKENMKALAGLLYKYSIPRHLAELNLAEYLNTGDGEKGTHPAFTHEQVMKIDEQIGITPHAEDVLCLIYTGFRPAELLKLTKADYRDGILYGGIKTEAGKNRAVPVSDKIKPYIDQKMQSDCIFLFPKDDGTQMSPDYFRDNYFYRVLDAAGIKPMPTQDHPAYYVPYSARHTFANMLKNVQGSDKDKARLIGHQDYKTTKEHYQSTELDELKAIVSQFY